MKQLSMFDKSKEPSKPYVVFKENCKELRKDFVKGSKFPLFDVRTEGVMIRIDDIYYTIKRKYCEVVK